MSRFSKPLIALALATIPFFVLVGTTSTVTVNGQIASDSRFNIGGLIMALIGLAIVFGVLRPSAPRDPARKSIAAAAGLLCLVQIANSIDLIRIEPLDWVMPDRHLPELQYSGLAENDYIYLSNKSPDFYRRTLTREKGKILGQAMQHRVYADLCHGGRYRADLVRAEQLPDYFDATERAEIERLASIAAENAPTECSRTMSNRLMGPAVDELNRQMDLFDRLEAEYLELAG
ncbi:hypothetical protein QWE_00045 [Agrobacterium albertimagni AOL15]|uniref:Transmembrane protein n=1 Tax=Agrobacterium albertimagni AOL15 TaxID=1156935 RepID=K2R135_9HYPH|nr:hypothetical protein [Agrobacterium albertimagni]EKF61547.1 hypothetical protein QWE_00045 [Agrobacterium albertimagni AOL15]